MKLETRRDLRPDAQAFDEIRFVTVPRYKTSGLSGDEWRISVKMQFFRKGRLIHEEGVAHKMKDAMSFAAWKYTSAIDDGKAFFAGEEDFCDQEGCAEKATVTYRKKFDYCREGHKNEIKYGERIRKFCDHHKTRGDCGLDDSDENYETV